jgi:hypothetical protein
MNNEYDNSNNSDNISNDNNGTIYNRYDSISDTPIHKDNSYEEDNDNMLNDNDNILNIYRYKFTKEFTDELYIFAKIHQYDHRKDFKDAWLIWKENNEILIETEIRRLTELGYNNDVLDKMFKSARYYFRNKNSIEKEQKQRCNYIGIQKQLITSMDNHIKMIIHNNKPSDAFIQFCQDENNLSIIKEEVVKLLNDGLKDHIEIKNKIKKTYKNRYFIIKNNKNNK